MSNSNDRSLKAFLRTSVALFSFGAAVVAIAAPLAVAQGSEVGERDPISEEIRKAREAAESEPVNEGASFGEGDGDLKSRFERHLRIADEALRTGNFSMAAGFLMRAHSAIPGDPEPLLRLSDIYQETGDDLALEQVQQRLLGLNPGDRDLTVEYGMTLLRNGKVSAARVILHRALDEKEDPRIFNALGVAFDLEGDHKSAQAHYLIALGLEQNNLAAMANLGLSLALSEDFPKAIRILTQLNDHPKSKEEHRVILDRVHAMAAAPPQ